MATCSMCLQATQPVELPGMHDNACAAVQTHGALARLDLVGAAHKPPVDVQLRQLAQAVAACQHRLAAVGLHGQVDLERRGGEPMEGGVGRRGEPSGCGGGGGGAGQRRAPLWGVAHALPGTSTCPAAAGQAPGRREA